MSYVCLMVQLSQEPPASFSLNLCDLCESAQFCDVDTSAFDLGPKAEMELP